MGDVLAELEAVLRSKPLQEKITPHEEALLEMCKGKGRRAFVSSAFGSSLVAWAVCGSLSHSQRLNLSVGSSILYGLWKFNRALNGCVDGLLDYEGSRVQKELANIILRKYQNNPSKVKLMYKHFYPEQVYTDVNPDQPSVWWRFRNSYVEKAVIQKVEDITHDSNHGKPGAEIKQLTTKPIIVAGEPSADPLEILFGYSETNKEVPHPEIDAVPRRRPHTHKKSHRHRHTHRADVPSSGFEPSG